MENKTISFFIWLDGHISTIILKKNASMNTFFQEFIPFYDVFFRHNNITILYTPHPSRPVLHEPLQVYMLLSNSARLIPPSCTVHRRTLIPPTLLPSSLVTPPFLQFTLCQDYIKQLNPLGSFNLGSMLPASRLVFRSHFE